LAALPSRDPANIAALEQSIESLIVAYGSHVVQKAVANDFDPMLRYAEGLLHGGTPDLIASHFKELIEQLPGDANVDLHALAQRLTSHLEKEATSRESAAIAQGLAIVLADHELQQLNISAAARSLQGALEIDLPDQPALQRQSLDCAARIAAADGDWLGAARMLDAATAISKTSTRAERTADEASQVTLLAQLVNSHVMRGPLNMSRLKGRDQFEQDPESRFVEALQLMNRIAERPSRQIRLNTL
jgi:hypothetical protein